MSAELVVILTAVLVAIPCALIGSFLILRRMAMLSDAISHAVLPGIFFAFMLAGGPEPIAILIGATIFGLLTVVLVEMLYRSGRVKEDASIGLVFPAMFALGVFLITRFAGRLHIDTQHVLYGEIAHVPFDPFLVGTIDLGPRALWTLGAITLLDLLFVVICFKELKLVSFDPGLATALGVSPMLFHYLLMAATSITAVSAFDAVGAILVVAMIIVPPATAYLLTDRLPTMLGLAVLAGVASALLGYFGAQALDASISGAMASAAGLLLGLAALVSPRYGFVSWLIRRARQQREFAGDLLVVHLVNQEMAASGRAPLDAVRGRFRWNDRFTRAVVNQLAAAGLVTLDADRVAVTDRGRARAAELGVA